MTTNLHLTVSQFNNASRILKQTESLIKNRIVSKVFIVALHNAGEVEEEDLGNNRFVKRIRLRTRKLPKTLFFQMIKFIEFSWKVLILSRRYKVKMVNVHSVFALPLGVLVKLVCGASLIYDPHELETETYGKNRISKILSQLIEKYLIKFAKLTVVVGSMIESWYRNKYNIDNTVTVMNCPHFQRPKNENLLREELNIPPDKKILLYQGGLWPGRGIELLLESFAAHDDGENVMVFMGFGELDELIKIYSADNSNIFLQNAADPTEVLRYTVSADYGIAYIDNPSLNDKFCLPNKFFEYIMAGLPVLVNSALEMSSIVREKKIGVVLNKLDTNSIKKGLLEIKGMDQLKLKQSLNDTSESFCWETQEILMIEAYKNFVVNGNNVDQ